MGKDRIKQKLQGVRAGEVLRCKGPETAEKRIYIQLGGCEQQQWRKDYTPIWPSSKQVLHPVSRTSQFILPPLWGDPEAKGEKGQWKDGWVGPNKLKSWCPIRQLWRISGMWKEPNAINTSKFKKWKWKPLSCVGAHCNPMDYTVHWTLQARTLEWVAFPFSRGSSQSRDRTQVSCIAHRFFTSWTTREAQEYWSG